MPKITLDLTSDEIGELFTGLTWRYQQDKLQDGESFELRAACDSAGHKLEAACIATGIVSAGFWDAQKQYPRRIVVKRTVTTWR